MARFITFKNNRIYSANKVIIHVVNSKQFIAHHTEAFKALDVVLHKLRINPQVTLKRMLI